MVGIGLWHGVRGDFEDFEAHARPRAPAGGKLATLIKLTFLIICLSCSSCLGQFKNRVYRNVVPIEYCFTDTLTRINSLLKIKGCYFSDEGTFSCIFFSKNVFALTGISSVYDTFKYKNGKIQYIDDGYTGFNWGGISLLETL